MINILRMELSNNQEPAEFLESFYAKMGISKDIDERYRHLRGLILTPSLSRDKEPSFAELELQLLRENGFKYL
jgi:hypothetical protein